MSRFVVSNRCLEIRRFAPWHSDCFSPGPMQTQPSRVLFLLLLASLSGACATDGEDEGPGEPVPGPCEATRPLDNPYDPSEPITCDFDYDPAGRLSHIRYFEDDDHNSNITWTYDGDRLAEIRVVVIRGMLVWDELLWTFESDRITRQRIDLYEDEVTGTAEYGLDGFAFIGSPFECEFALSSSETIVREVVPGNYIDTEYSYEGSFESGTRERTGVDSPTGEVISTATFEYDSEARLVRVEEAFSEGRTSELSIDRDEAGRILQQTEDEIDDDDESHATRTYRYDDFGNVLTLDTSYVSNWPPPDGRDFEEHTTYGYDCW